VTDQPYPPLRPQPPLHQRRREPRTPWALIIGAVVLAVLVLFLVLVLLDGGDGEETGTQTSPSPGNSSVATGSGAPPSSVAATGTPAVTPAPTPPPPVVAAPAGILPVGSVVEVTADELRIRQAPATSSPIVTSVGVGELLFLPTNANAIGPVETGGFLWYVVLHVPGYRDWPNPAQGDPPLSGWVAAGSATESFLSLAPSECPAGEPHIAMLYSMTPWDRVACFGERPLTVEGTFGCGGCGGEAPGIFTPDWLAHPLNFNVFGPSWSTPIATVENLVLRVAPELPQLAPEQAGSILRVTGHFNDARSVDCVVAPGEPGLERAANELAAEWYCREQFVVDTWEVIGTDPAYTAD
jgi:hypothetical protein